MFIIYISRDIDSFYTSAILSSTMDTRSILSIIQIVLAVLLTVAILLQHSEAGAGGAFGGNDTVSSWRTRRGFEKFLFIATIVIVILFVVSALVSLRLA